jgi:hypothetical protein
MSIHFHGLGTVQRPVPVSIITKHVSPLSVLNGHCDVGWWRGLWTPITAPQRKDPGDHFDMWANLWPCGRCRKGGIGGGGAWWTVSKRGCYLNRDTSFTGDKSLAARVSLVWLPQPWLRLNSVFFINARRLLQLQRLFSVKWDERVIMYGELVRRGEEAVVPCFKAWQNSYNIGHT